MIVQSAALPLLSGIAAWTFRSYALWILVGTVWLSGLWQTNGQLHSILTPVIAMTIMAALYTMKNDPPKIAYALLITVISAGLYWWMVRRFIGQTEIIEWAITLAGVFLSIIYIQSLKDNTPHPAFLALLAPLGGMALVVALFGSIKIGVISGTMASIALAAWVLSLKNITNDRVLAQIVTLPTLFVSVLAYYFAEIQVELLFILLLNWLLIPVLNRYPALIQYTMVFILGIATTGMALWLGWPEQPPY